MPASACHALLHSGDHPSVPARGRSCRTYRPRSAAPADPGQSVEPARAVNPRGALEPDYQSPDRTTREISRLVRLLHWIFLNSARLGLKPGSQPASRATAPRPPPTRRRFFAWRPPVPLAKKGQLVGYHHISICQLSEPYGKFITVLHQVVVGMSGRKEVGVALGVGIVGRAFIA